MEAKKGEREGRGKAVRGEGEGAPARRGERVRSKVYVGPSPSLEDAPLDKGANILILTRGRGAGVGKEQGGALAKREGTEGAPAKRDDERREQVQGEEAATTARRAGAGGAGAGRRSRQRRSADTGSRTPAALERSVEDCMTHPGEESGGRRS